jgi:hypothetical protein
MILHLAAMISSQASIFLKCGCGRAGRLVSQSQSQSQAKAKSQKQPTINTANRTINSTTSLGISVINSSYC